MPGIELTLQQGEVSVLSQYCPDPYLDLSLLYKFLKNQTANLCEI